MFCPSWPLNDSRESRRHVAAFPHRTGAISVWGVEVMLLGLSRVLVWLAVVSDVRAICSKFTQERAHTGARLSQNE